MPIVQVRYKSHVAIQSSLSNLQKKLQQIVASALDIPESADKRLFANNVALEFIEAHRLDKGRDLRINVFAKNYPERVENIEERSDQMLHAIKELVDSKTTVAVCIWLTEVGVSVD